MAKAKSEVPVKEAVKVEKPSKVDVKAGKSLAPAQRLKKSKKLAKKAHGFR